MSRAPTPKSSNQPPAKKQVSKQYDLFTTFFGDAQNLSNTIELWDAIPKYSVSPRVQNSLRDEKGNLPVHEHEFLYRPTKEGMPRELACKVTVKPASIKNSDGTRMEFYPSTDEELIEEVLKKIFSDQQFGMHNTGQGESWVRFSLNMIQKELISRGKTRSIDEIKKSLEILSSTIIELQLAGESKNLEYTSPILTDMTRTTKAQFLADPKSMWAARLPGLISKSVNELTYRQFNYGTLMSLSTQLARWLHKRMSHQYTQANLMDPYHLSFNSIQRDSGLLHHSRTSSNVQLLEKALEELQKAKVLLTYEKKETRLKKKIMDIIYTLRPTMDFVDETRRANARQRDHRDELEGRPPQKSGPHRLKDTRRMLQ